MKYKIIYSNELCHHGVKGMKWGVRKEYVPKGRKSAKDKVTLGKQAFRKASISSSEIRKTVREKDLANKKAQENHNRIVKKARETGKSAAEIEQEESSHKRLQLTDKQKKAIAIGAVVAGTALVAYGVYKLKTRHDARQLELMLWNEEASKMDALIDWDPSPLVKTGDTSFLKNAFAGSDYNVFTSSQSDKAAVDKLMSKETGKWWNSLSKTEKMGVETYSGSLYTEMNNALWSAKGKNIDDYAPPHIAGAIKAANSALSKSSYPETMVCTQGLSAEKAAKFLGISEADLYVAAKNPKAASKLIGAVNTNHGLFSTSTNNGGVKYKVLTPKGAHAAFIEHVSNYGDLPHPPSWNGKSSGGPPYSNEFETLFEAGSKFMTKGIQWNREGGYIEVALEYVFPK